MVVVCLSIKFFLFKNILLKDENERKKEWIEMKDGDGFVFPILISIKVFSGKRERNMNFFFSRRQRGHPYHLLLLIAPVINDDADNNNDDDYP